MESENLYDPKSITSFEIPHLYAAIAYYMRRKLCCQMIIKVEQLSTLKAEQIKKPKKKDIERPPADSPSSYLRQKIHPSTRSPTLPLEPLSPRLWIVCH
jgi:hypothetical protein